PNGSGKTTLLNIVSGFTRADAGTVRLGGERIDALAPFEVARRGVARLFQAGRLAPTMTALDTVAVARAAAAGKAGLGAPAASAAQCRGEAMWLLGRLGLAAAAATPA